MPDPNCIPDSLALQVLAQALADYQAVTKLDEALQAHADTYAQPNPDLT